MNISRLRKFNLYIIAGFSFLIILIIALSIIGSFGLDKSRELFKQTYLKSFQTLSVTEQANTDLIAVHRAMKDVALSRTDAELQAALADVDLYDANVKGHFEELQKIDPNDPLLADVIAAYNDWAPIRARTIAFAQNGQYEQAAENTRTAGAKQVDLITGEMQEMINRKKADTDSAYQQSETNATNYLRFLGWTATVALILAIGMSLYIRRRLFRFQSELHEEKEKLQITFDSIGDGIITTDTDRNVTGLNNIAEQFTGWRSEEAAGKPFAQIFDITNANTGERAKDPVEEVLKTDAVCLLENHTVLTSRDGIQRHIADSAAPIKDETGRTSGVVMIFRDVTERKKAEKLLKESEEKFRTVFMQSPTGICITDSCTGEILEMNERFAQIMGRSCEELTGCDWMSITHPDDIQDNLGQSALMNAGIIQGFRMEKRFIKPDNSVVWTMMSIAQLPSFNNTDQVHLCMLEDITQQKLAEEELRVSESRLRRAQEIANVGNWEIDLNSEQVWSSEQALKILGLNSCSPILPVKTVSEVICAEDRPRMDEALRILWEENKPYSLIYKIIRVDDGAMRFVRTTAVAECSDDGQPRKITGVTEDVTELITAEIALEKSRNQLEATLQSTADGIMAVDLDGKIIFYNEQHKKMWRIPDEIDGPAFSDEIFKYCNDMKVSEEKHETISEYVSVLESSVGGTIELKDGRTLERHSKPMRVGGEIAGYVVSYRDITERKRAEQALLQSNMQLEATLQSTADGIVAVDLDGKIASYNEQFKNMWRIPDEIDGPEFSDEIFKWNNDRKVPEKKQETLSELVALLESSVNDTIELKDGRTFERYPKPMLVDGEITGYVISFRDITERKRAEQALLQSNMQLEATLQSTADGILAIDLDGKIIFYNEQYKTMWRIPDELDGPAFYAEIFDHIENNMIAENVVIPRMTEFRELLQTLYYDQFDLKDGRSFELHTRPIRMGGEITGFLLSYRDVTERKRWELALAESNIQLEATLHSTADGIIAMRLDGGIIFFNEQFKELWQIPHELDNPSNFADIFYYIMHDMVDSQIPDPDMPGFLKSMENYTEGQVDLKDGRTFELHSRPYLLNGEIAGYVMSIRDITEQLCSQRELLRSKTQLEATLQSTADSIMVLDSKGKIIFRNEQYLKLWHIPKELENAADLSDIFECMDGKITNVSDHTIPAFLKSLENVSEERITLKDGRTLETYKTPYRLDGEIAGFVLSARDITERLRSEQALLDSESRHRAMIANISDTIVIIDQNRLLKYASPNLEKWFGWEPEELIGKTMLSLIHPDDLEMIRNDYLAIMKANCRELSLEVRLRRKDETYTYISITAVNMLSDPTIQGILMNFHDISESKKRESEILYLNYHDLLTGLYNRAFFEEECARLDSERQLPISVIMGDINGLKLINDAFGHSEGDKLLIEIAKILGANCRKEDILARTGGDEFCILLPQTTPEEARSICKRVLSDCSNYENRTDKEAFYLSISLGYATKTDTVRSIESILTEAEEYMYKQKLLERKSMRSSLLSSIKTTMFEKSHLTAEHEDRLVALSKRIGQVMDLPDAQLSELELLSTLHDLGKLSIDDRILNKPGKLTEEEWVQVRKHPEVGYRIAQASPELAPIAEFILSHHERWDGKGYPQGLSGEAIPLLSRIVSIVDAYDAMTQDRPYRKAMTANEAIREINANSGTQFDPKISRIFVNVIKDFGG